jgi:hypothetical protein
MNKREVRLCQITGHVEKVSVSSTAVMGIFSTPKHRVYELRFQDEKGRDLLHALLPEELQDNDSIVVFQEDDWTITKYGMLI